MNNLLQVVGKKQTLPYSSDVLTILCAIHQSSYFTQDVRKKQNAVSRSKTFDFMQHLFSFMKTFAFQFDIKSD